MLSTHVTKVGVNPVLVSDLYASKTSKLDRRYFEHYKIDRNELQNEFAKTRINKMAKKHWAIFKDLIEKKIQIDPSS